MQCPVFLLFLDCVYQLRKMFPGSFQFSEVYLVHVWDALSLGIFGTFSFNSPHDRGMYCLRTDGSVVTTATTLIPYLLPSAWDWSQQFSDSQISLMYDPLYAASCDADASSNDRKLQHGIAVSGNGFGLQTKPADVQLWSLCYLRWLTPLMIVGGGQTCEYLTQCLLVEEISQLRQQVVELERATEGRDKRQSVLIFGSGSVATDLMNTSTSAGLTQRLSSSFPFVPRHSSDETPSALSQVPSVDTYLECSRLSTDFNSLAATDDSTSASFYDDFGDD